MRPEIQALRALAVGLVVAFHLWPSAVPGGFVGVDVFFAISGFLITGQLVREVERTGTLSLMGFWARRARRILPAALLTLLVCAVATLAFVPDTYWTQYFADLRASAAYVQNWHLAANAVDYLHADDPPSVVQHFWSLSAEEQFYLVWPVLIIGALWVATRRPARVRRRSIALALGSVTAASLAYSVVATHANPVPAFFVTPTRAWEFGAGGLLALVTAPRISPAARAAVSWAGLATIAVVAATYSGRTAFPGWAAVPTVLAPVAVMWAGAPGGRWSPMPLLGLRPVQFVGDVSYAVYLWHWPLIILVPIVSRRALDSGTKVAIVAVTLLAAWATKTLVEDPVRNGAFLRGRPPRWTFGLAAAATLAVVAVTNVGDARLGDAIQSAEARTAQIVAARPACLGAAARDPQRRCRNSRLRRTVVPTPIQAQREGDPPCRAVARRPEVCGFGVASRRARTTVALLGDSHALHWRPALQTVARRKRWRGLSIYQSQCPFTLASHPDRPTRLRCGRWDQQVLAWLRSRPEVSTVIVSQHVGAGVVVPPGQSTLEAKTSGFIRAWNALPSTVKHVVVLRDVAYATQDTAACVERAMARKRDAGAACAIPRAISLRADPAVTAARRLNSPRVRVVDLSDFMCGRTSCFPVVGGVLVHKDIGHITHLFSSTLAPFLLRELRALRIG